MLFEFRIGKLIRRLNPYTSGDMETMRCGTELPVLPNDLGDQVIALGTALKGYAQSREHNNQPNVVHEKLNAVTTAEKDLDSSIATDFDLRVDNDYRQDYMTWIFRGQPHAIKRALRVTYRYELTDKKGAGTGVYATEHVLIGYAGSNG